MASPQSIPSVFPSRSWSGAARVASPCRRGAGPFAPSSPSHSPSFTCGSQIASEMRSLVLRGMGAMCRTLFSCMGTRPSFACPSLVLGCRWRLYGQCCCPSAERGSSPGTEAKRWKTVKTGLGETWGDLKCALPWLLCMCQP